MFLLSEITNRWSRPSRSYLLDVKGCQHRLISSVVPPLWDILAPRSLQMTTMMYDNGLPLIPSLPKPTLPKV